MIEISSQNLNGNDVPTKGQINIYKLKSINKIYLKRSWNLPDIYSISEEEFKKQFPFFAYKDEDNEINFAKEKKVYSNEFDTKISRKYKINDIKNWEQGSYYIEIKSTDKFGEPIKSENYIEIYNPLTLKPFANSSNFIIPIINNCEPGDKAKYLIGSSEKGSKIYYEIEHKGKIIKTEWITLNNEQKIIEIPITEIHRGNLSVHFTMVKHNRAYPFYDLITVPYSNKELQENPK